MKIIYARFRKNISVWLKLILLLLVAASLSVLSADAWAATFYVNSTLDLPDINPGDGVCNAGNSRRGAGSAGTLCTLRAAIMEANAHLGADTIILKAGTYTITIPGQNEDAGVAGDFDINSDLTITGAGSATTIIDGGGLDRVFDIHSGTVNISGVTIRGGTLGLDEFGGGIYNRGGTLTLSGVHLNNNSATLGGAINNSGTVTLINCTVSNNSARYYGGGIYNNTFALGASLTVIDSSISDCFAGSSGGGVFNESGGTMSLSDSIISGNVAFSVAGGICNQGTMVLSDSTISENRADTNGGGISHGGVEAATLVNVSVYGNFALSGGGIINGGPMTLTNVTVSKNGTTGPGGGGGIVNYGQLIVINGTISDNSVTIGPGGGIVNGVASTIKNTIIAGNSGGNCSGAVTSDGHNLEDADTCGLNGPGDLINTNPLLGPLQNNGGPTLTHALLPGSPAIDAGDNSVCPVTDQRGVARPKDGDGNGLAICDIGAFELTYETYAISGKVTSSAGSILRGVPGVTMMLSGTATGTTATDANGNYTFAGLANGTYTVTPSMAGYAFKPINSLVTISGANITGQDFKRN